MQKNNILFVVDERKMGGVSVLLKDILNNINLNHYNIDILVLHNNGNMLNNLPKNVHIIYGSKYFSAIDYTLKEALLSFNPKIIFHKLNVILAMKTGLIKKRIVKERKKILKRKYDVEIAFKDGFTALFTAVGDSRKKVHWLHYEYKLTNPNGKYDKLFREILPLFDEIVAVSDSVETAFNKIYHLENKTHVIDNLVDTSKIKSLSSEKNDQPFNKDDLNIISVGRIHAQKGYKRLLDVIYRLDQDGILPANFKLRIYGDGPQFKELKDKLIKYKLEDKVLLMGRTDNPYKYLIASKLFILSSIYEPFGLVIVEALTLKVPVLATQNHATEKLIDNKKNGLIVENSFDGLYNGLKYLFENPNEIQKYRRNLSHYNYDNSLIIKQIEDVLNYEK